ncbi:phosphatase PAP2 family protein [Spiroplasma endosymbiont of Panorpa germanica]|uniref:phosphatase PAP2 family protein n=1 Tax=Spiroplasma endosymbiont of Panorpa germanica TaxID=3066314 RepID=UPI0030D3D5AE
MTRTIYKQWYIKTTLAFAMVLLIGFIATSFDNIDRWFSDVMGEWVKVEFIKFWVIFYNEMGFTCLFLILLISIFIIVESWHAKNNDNPRSQIILYTCYAITITIFLVYNLVRLIGLPTEDTGWGLGVDPQYLTNNTYKIISRISIFIIESGILIGSILFLRLKVSKTNALIEKRASFVAVSALIFIVVSFFLLTLLLKQSFGRPFYLNVEFERYIGKVELDQNGWAIDIELSQEAQKLVPEFPDLKERILDSYNNSNYWTQADRYYKWYEVNGNWFQNLQFWYGGKILTWFIEFDLDYVKPPAWNNQDFPSGHTISGFTGIYYALFASVLIKDDKKRIKATNTLFTIWLISEIIMINTLVIARTHYVSDVWFSFVFCAFFLVASLRFTNTWTTKAILKKRHKKSLSNNFEIVENKVLIFFQEDNKIFVSKTSSKKINKKMKKYLNAAQITKFLHQLSG